MPYGNLINIFPNHDYDPHSGVILTLSQPNGKTISPGSPEYNEDAQRKVINVLIDGRAEVILL